MKPVKLPNGFVLDLDSVHYIQSEIVICHPFTGAPTEMRGLTISCEGQTIIDMTVTKDQAKVIQSIILNHLNGRG